MPPEIVAVVEQPLDQLRRPIDPVIFDIQHRLRTRQNLGGPLKYLKLETFHIDFDQSYRSVRDQIIEPDTWNRRMAASRLRSGGHRGAAEVAHAAIVRHLEGHHSTLTAAGIRERSHIH